MLRLRLSAIVMAVGLALPAVAAAHAGGTSRSPSGTVTGPSIAAKIQEQLRPPGRVAEAQARLDAVTLAVPASDFSAPSYPASLVGQGYVTPGDLSVSPFVGIHSSAGYQGLVQGYEEHYQDANIQTDYYYQANVFADTNSAFASYKDAYSTVRNSTDIAPTDCSGEYGTPCTILGYGTAGGSGGVLTIVTVNFCTLEFDLIEPTSGLSSLTVNDISGIASTVISDGVSRLRAACATAAPPAAPSPTPAPGSGSPSPQPVPTSVPSAAPVRFTLLSVRVESASAQPDWSLVAPPVKAVKVGTMVRLAVYYHVSSAPPNFAYTELLTVTRNGETVVHQQYPDSLGSSPVDTYRSSWKFTPHTPGKYAVTIAISMGGRTARSSATFSADQSAPTSAKSVSFTLDRVNLLNPQGRAQSTYHVGQQFFVHLGYSVRNARHGTQAFVAVTFEAPGTGKALFTPHEDELPAVNGRQSYRTGFLTPNRPGSTLTIAVGVTIGRSTQEKFTSLTIVR